MTRIDPKTMEVVAPTRGIPADGIPVALAVGEGSVWVAVNQGRALAVIEDRTGARRLPRAASFSRRPARATFSVLREAVALAVGEHAVWALERGQGEVTRIDPQTGTPKRLAEGHGASSSIAAGGGAVWLGGINGVSKLDPATGTELGSTFVAEVLDSQTTAIAVGGGAVWFTGSSSARLWHIDSGGDTVLDSFAGRSGPERGRGRRRGHRLGGEQRGRVGLARRPESRVGGEDRARRVARRHRHAFDRVWTSPGTPSPLRLAPLQFPLGQV